MTHRRFRWLNSKDCPFPGRRDFFTPRADTKFEGSYLFSTYDPTDGEMTDWGVDVLSASKDRVVLVSNLIERISTLDLIDDVWVWAEHPDRSFMLQSVKEHAIRLGDPNDSTIPVVEVTMDESGFVELLVEVEGDGGDPEESPGVDESADAPVEWVDAGA